MKILFLSLVIAGTLFSCANNKQTSNPGAASPEVVANKPLEGTYWELTELNGKPVEPAKEGAKPNYIYLDAAKKRVSLSGGCNVMGGSYELKEGNRIQFGQLISTMMACPDMTYEDGLKKMASSVDNYAIQGDQLSFAKARMAPAARFKAVTPPAGFKMD